MPLLNDGNNIDTLIIPKDKTNFKIEGNYKPGLYDRVELLNELNIKNGKADDDINIRGPFKWKQANLNEEVENGTIFHIKSAKFAIRYEKKGERVKVPSDLLSKKECGVGTNEDANKEIYSLFNKDGLFSYPKTSTLIKYLGKFRTDHDDIILDFFAGSGTTGDSVMQLNAEDGGKRKFVLVQIPEPINPKKNKAAYDFVKNELKAEPTIFEITKERLKRAADKIQEENVGKPAKSEKVKCDGLNEGHCPACKGEHIIITKERKAKDFDSLDLGFKIFETTPIWEDYNFEAEQFDSSQTLFDMGKLSEDDIKALLITWKTYDGIALTQDLESIDLSGYTAYYGNGRLYLMNKGFTTNSLKALLEKIDKDKHFEPKSIIAFGYHLESKSLREISENVKSYSNKKNIDIDFITRY
jgi:adenine-specific DNA-methyltransferase